MAAILRKTYEIYHWLNVDLQDERTKDWPLMSSPFPTLGILIFYNYFVKSLGPRLMKDKKPFKLDGVLILFNIVQIISNIFVFYACLIYGWGGEYNWICEPFDTSVTPKNIAVARAVYGYFLLKVSDLLDTVFFVLRKKNGQVSFLHVYHHTGMVMLTWAATKWLPGGHETFIGLVNSIVHIIMYSYYLVTIIKPEQKKNIWWKRHLTQLQMIQFGMIAVHSGLLLMQPNCKYPRWTPWVLMPQNAFMFFLFYDFYKKAYSNKKLQSDQLSKGKVTENGTATKPVENGTSNKHPENGKTPENGSVNETVKNGKLVSKVA